MILQESICAHFIKLLIDLVNCQQQGNQAIMLDTLTVQPRLTQFIG